MFFKLQKIINQLTSILLIFSALTLMVNAANFQDNSQATFGGTFSNTYWNPGENGVSLTSGGVTAGSGTYTSEVKDTTGSPTTWNSFGWIPSEPYDKQLPNNQATESIYDLNNVSMTSNYLLYHLEETGATNQTFTDNSGSSNNGTCTTNCPTLNTAGVFANARTFNGAGQFINLPNTSSIKNKNLFSMSFWVKPGNLTRENVIYYEPVPNNLTRERLKIAIISPGRLRITGRTNDTATNATTYLTSATNLNTSTWYFVIVNINTTTRVVQLITNNNLESNTVGGMTAFPNTNPNQPPAIGKNLSTNTTALLGSLDEIAFFDNRNIAHGTGNNSDSFTFFQRGITDLRFQIRSCSDVTCSSGLWRGPDGTSATFFRDQTDGAFPDYTLSGVPTNQYFQYKADFINNRATYGVNANLILKEVHINYTYTAPVVSLALAIRTSDDTGSSNVCDLGNVTTSATATCSYGLKITSNATNGYIVSVQTDGPLTSGTYNLSDASSGTGGGGGNLINGSTLATEKYGIFVNTGSITSGGSISRKTVFNAGGSNSVLLNYATPTQMVESFGQNLPANIEPSRNIIITHNLNISGSTPADNYTQKVTYTVTPKF